MADRQDNLRINISVDGSGRARADLEGIGGGFRQVSETGDQSRGILGRVRQRFEGLRESAFSLRGALAAVGGTLAFRQILRATSRQERAERQLAASVQRRGQAFNRSADELIEHAQALQRVTTTGDEEIMELQNQLLSFRNISGEAFDRTTEVILDFAEVTGRDASGAVRTLAVALNNPAEGLSRLRQAGIDLDAEQRENIQTMAEQGRMSEAQAALLHELESSYGGAARAARDSFGGALEGVKNAFGDLLEVEGSLPEAQDRLESLAETLADPEVQEGADRLFGVLISGATRFAEVMARVPDFGDFLAVQAMEVMHGGATREDQLETQIEDAERRLSDLGAELERPRFLRMRPVAHDDRTLIREIDQELANIEEAEAELERLSRARARSEPEFQVDPQPFFEVGEGLDAFERSTESADTRTNDLEGSVNSVMSSLNEQAREMGRSREELELLDAQKLLSRDLTWEQETALQAAILAYEDRAAAVQRAEEAESRHQENMESANRIIREQQTEVERLAQEWNEAARLFADGYIDFETLQRVNEDLQQQSDETTREISRQWEQAGRNIQDTLGQTMLQTMRGDTEDLLDIWRNTIERMVAEAAAAELMDQLFGGVEGADGDGIVGFANLIGSLFGGGGSNQKLNVQPGEDPGVFESVDGGGLFGRRFGGTVGAGGVYEWNEGATPESVTVGDRHFLMMGDQPGRVDASASMQRPTNHIRTGDNYISAHGGTSPETVAMMHEMLEKNNRMMMRQIRRELEKRS